MHVHLDHEHCLEVIVMRGRSDELKAVTGRMIGTRGVIQGGAEYVAESTLSLTGTGRRVHQHEGQEPHSHPHSHPHTQALTPTKPSARRASKTRLHEIGKISKKSGR
jgi:CopG family nickel-responsive transcriptional regulator